MTESELRATTKGLMAALRMRDQGTHDHSQRVARVSALIGMRLGLGINAEDMLMLHHGALLHDIGKIQTKEHVLKKPDKHTHIECMHMREHAEAGAEVLADLGFPSPIVAAVLEHHERWDGLGYPHGLKGAEISPFARILAVADAFDAITNNRCYRNGRSYNAAAAEITRGLRKQFDSMVVTAFFEIPEERLFLCRTEISAPQQPV